MIHWSRLGKSISYAWQGLKLAAEENTFRVLLMMTGVAFIAIAVFSLKPWEVIAVIVVIMVVLVLEILNSAFERMSDLVQPKVHSYVREIKDLMAAAVFVAALAAVIIGLAIFLPHIHEMIG